MAPVRKRLRILRRLPESIRPASPRPQRRDCQGQLIAALEAMAGPTASIIQATMRPWCSATFVGAQHHMVMGIGGADAAQRAAELAARLSEADFGLRGHIVADLSVDDIGSDAQGAVSISLAILTIEDW
jgi:hypothetical protein